MQAWSFSGEESARVRATTTTHGEGKEHTGPLKQPSL